MPIGDLAGGLRVRRRQSLPVAWQAATCEFGPGQTCRVSLADGNTVTINRGPGEISFDGI
jgi:hypothetical protein